MLQLPPLPDPLIHKGPRRVPIDNTPKALLTASRGHKRQRIATHGQNEGQDSSGDTQATPDEGEKTKRPKVHGDPGEEVRFLENCDWSYLIFQPSARDFVAANVLISLAIHSSTTSDVENASKVTKTMPVVHGGSIQPSEPENGNAKSDDGISSSKTTNTSHANTRAPKKLKRRANFETASSLAKS